MARTPISAVIIALNEERNIGRCIDSLKDVVDEVLVLDSGSSDLTVSICLEKGARVEHVDWQGYAATKNHGNQLARYDVILSLDADEALSDPLKKSINQMADQGLSAACEFNRLTNYCGTWIKHGSWYPDKQLRVFNRNNGKWQGLIHEKVQTDQPIIHLKGDLLHYSYYSTQQHIDQANKFTTLTAEDAFRKGKKSTWFKRNFAPGWKFFRDYIIKAGILDGYHGYVVCRISAQATYWKYTKLRELWKRES